MIWTFTFFFFLHSTTSTQSIFCFLLREALRIVAIWNQSVFYLGQLTHENVPSPVWRKVLTSTNLTIKDEVKIGIGKLHQHNAVVTYRFNLSWFCGCYLWRTLLLLWAMLVYRWSASDTISIGLEPNDAHVLLWKGGLGYPAAQQMGPSSGKSGLKSQCDSRCKIPIDNGAHTDSFLPSSTSSRSTMIVNRYPASWSAAVVPPHVPVAHRSCRWPIPVDHRGTIGTRLLNTWTFKSPHS